jgi:curved DNA-binding protein CbpA
MNQIELDPYEILEVDYDASLNTIRQAFKKLVLKHHPDRGGNPQNFHIIKGAYAYIFKELKKQESLQQREEQTYNEYEEQRNNQIVEDKQEIETEEKFQPIVSSKNFNVDNFNNLYSRYRVESITDHGYGTTMMGKAQARLKDDALRNNKVQEFGKRELIIYEEPQSMMSTHNFDNLGGDKPSDYTSGFNINDTKKKISFTDYMRAHSECEQISSSTANVRNTDFKSVDDLIQTRGNISREMSKEDLQKENLRKKKNLYEEKMRRLRLHQKEEEIEKKYNARQSFIRYT